MAPRKALLALLLSGCLTRPELLRRDVDALQAEAPRCAGFAAFDRRLQATWAEVPEAGATDELLATHARLSAARRTCARQTLAGLLATREKRGVQAAQEELDAMARAWDDEAFEALLREAFGAQLADLRPLVAEARAHAAGLARPRLDARDDRALEAWRPVDHSSDGSAPLRDTDGKAAHTRDAERERDRRDDRALEAWRPADHSSDGSAPLRDVQGKAPHTRDAERERDRRDDQTLQAWRPADSSSDGSTPLQDVNGKAPHARDAERERDRRDDRALEAWRPTDQASDGSAPLREAPASADGREKNRSADRAWEASRPSDQASARAARLTGDAGHARDVRAREASRPSEQASARSAPRTGDAGHTRDVRALEASRPDSHPSDGFIPGDDDGGGASGARVDAREVGALRPGAAPPSASACRAQRPREGLACLVEVHAAAPGGDLLPAIADELAERGRHATPPPDARALAELLDLARQLPAPAAQETLRAGLTDLLPLEWPRVEAAARSGHPDLAARLARPFMALREQAPRVDALVDAAVALHLRLAAEAGPRAAAAALHRHLAASLGGPSASWPAPSGGWETARWTCPRPPPSLPPAPRGARLLLSARCRPVEAASTGAASDDQRTFDLEHSLARERIDGDVAISCGAAYQRVSFSVTTLADQATDGPLAAQDASRSHQGPLARELERAAAIAHRLCGAPAAAPCDDLDDARALDVEERLTAHALSAGRWATCAGPWLERRYGLPPPAPP